VIVYFASGGFTSSSTGFIASIGFIASQASTAHEHTFATYKALPVDIFLGAHGVYFNMLPN
jgi:hypothetical protein